MNEDLKLIENYQNDNHLVNQFHLFIEKVFPRISFTEWHQKGFWTKDYIPFSLIDNNRIISNVSAALMNVYIDGSKYKAVQIGAVATLDEYKNKGLARRLMNYVIEKYHDDVDLFFLFANESVLDFYPKFGFNRITEKLFLQESNLPKPKNELRKLDLVNEDDFALVDKMLRIRLPITKIFGCENYYHITWWHILNTFRNDIYLLEDEKIIFIKKEEENTLQIYDVIYSQPFDIVEVLPKIIQSGSLKKIIYHFPPDQIDYSYNKIIDEESYPFILSKIEFENSSIKFPVTAQT